MILSGLLGIVMLAGVFSLFSGNFQTALLCLGPIAAFIFFTEREPSKTTIKRAEPFMNQQVNISVRSDHELYYHYSAEFYRLVEAVALLGVRNEMEAVIQVLRNAGDVCAVRLHLDLNDHAIPDRIILGDGFRLSHNNSIVEYKTENATGFTTPTLVRDMILSDMKPSEPGLNIDPVDVSLPLQDGAYSLITIRFKVNYKPVY